MVVTDRENPEPLGRTQRKRNNKIRQILIATAEALDKDGYHAMNMDAVAEKMDLTKATLYHYFGSKDDLIVACLNLVADEVNARLQKLADETKGLDASARLRALVEEQLTILLIDYPEAARLFAQPLEWPPAHRRLIRTLRRPHDAIFREVVEAGVRSGEFHDVDPDVALHCLYGAINYTPVWARTKPLAFKKRLTSSVCDVVLRMLCGPGSA